MFADITLPDWTAMIGFLLILALAGAGVALHGAQRKEDMEASPTRVRVLLPYRDGWLVQELRNEDYPWNLGKTRHIGGGIEKGETAIEAMVREIREELNREVDPKELSRLCVHYNEILFVWGNHGLEPMECNATGGDDKTYLVFRHSINNDKHLGFPNKL